MLNVSFYLLTPTAKSKSNLYVSISDKYERLRFSTKYSLLTDYCNKRGVKGSKDLLKKNSEFYPEYSQLLVKIRNKIIKIGMELKTTNEKIPLDIVRERYYENTFGKIVVAKPWDIQFDNFVSNEQVNWTEGTRKHYMVLKNNLIQYEKDFGKLFLQNINEEFWFDFRNNYLIKKKKLGNATINGMMKKLNSFLKYLIKNKIISSESIRFDELKKLEEVQPFKIALTVEEIERLVKLDLSDNETFDQVRDLFYLEILTGQRYSDMNKILNKENINGNYIQFNQQKTKIRISVPLHEKLKDYLFTVFDKYPNGFTMISDQKFNEYIKLICKSIGMDQIHNWITLSGKVQTQHSEFRYNLVSSHSGRITFCTQCKKQGYDDYYVMKISGHKNHKQFTDYIKIESDEIYDNFKDFLAN